MTWIPDGATLEGFDPGILDALERAAQEKKRHDALAARMALPVKDPEEFGAKLRESRNRVALAGVAADRARRQAMEWFRHRYPAEAREALSSMKTLARLVVMKDLAKAQKWVAERPGNRFFREVLECEIKLRERFASGAFGNAHRDLATFMRIGRRRFERFPEDTLLQEILHWARSSSSR